MTHPRNRTLARGIYKRGNSYYLDYKDETGKRVRRSAATDLHRALDLLYSTNHASMLGKTASRRKATRETSIAPSMRIAGPILLM